VIRHSDRPGKFEQILTLSVPGDYHFAIRARDKNGTLESFRRTLPVNILKDKPVQAAKYLPSEYGQSKTVMKCPKCGKEYELGVAYCSHDGSKLKPVERVIHYVLDASLIGAGIDTRTPESQHAKKLGLDWLNPFVTKEQIDQDIQRLVDDVIKK